MKYQPNNMLVTGGAGFIGANFIHYLMQHDKSVRIINLDKLTYASDLNHLATIADDERYQFIKGDVCDIPLLQKIFREFQIDTIVHFAAESHVDRSIHEPSLFIQTNIVGTFNLLDAAKNYWLDEMSFDNTRCRFHHISTDEVYGSLNDDDSPFTEQTAYSPRSPYSAVKASSDHLVNAFHHTYGMPITISNSSNNYGKFQHAEKFIPTVILACLKDSTVPLYGDGSNIRDWLYVTDHCQAIDKIIRDGRVGETYNVGANNEYTNIEITHLICKQLGKNPDKIINFVNDRPGHDYRYAIDSSKLQNELNWKPQTDFNTALNKTINYYENLISTQ